MSVKLFPGVYKPFLNSFNDNPVLDKRYLTHFASELLFLTEKIAKRYLSMIDVDLIDGLQEQLFPVVFPDIGFKIAHGLI
jgi:hypothetical protein